MGYGCADGRGWKPTGVSDGLGNRDDRYRLWMSRGSSCDGNDKETETKDGSMSRSVLDRDDRMIAIMSNVTKPEKGGGPRPQRQAR